MTFDREMRRLMREEKKLQKLGSDKPRCGRCGYDNPTGLEAHHVAGKANSSVTVWLCRNCHAEMSDRQEDFDPDLRSADVNRDPLLKQAAMAQGVAALLIVLAIMLVIWGQWNVQASTDLTTSYGADWYSVVTASVPQ